jgi:hypothetical protein
VSRRARYDLLAPETETTVKYTEHKLFKAALERDGAKSGEIYVVADSLQDAVVVAVQYCILSKSRQSVEGVTAVAATCIVAED